MNFYSQLQTIGTIGNTGFLGVRVVWWLIGTGAVAAILAWLAGAFTTASVGALAISAFAVACLTLGGAIVSAMWFVRPIKGLDVERRRAKQAGGRRQGQRCV